MEKLGVDVDEELSKQASDDPKGVCPKCGSKLLPAEGVNVPKCPKCGTEPFEKTDDA